MLNSIESFLNIPATILTIIVGLITIYIFFSNKKKPQQNNHHKKQLPSPKEQPSNLPSQYKFELGKRHKHLRENVLNLDLRAMAEFYELKSVSELEEYENGIHELPISFMQKVESFFFIRKEYMSGTCESIFERFILSSCSNDLNEYLDKGFSPTLLCNPSNDDLFVYIVLSKGERGFKRIIVSDRYGSFMPTSGGKGTLQLLIQALSKRGISPDSIPIWQVSLEVWQQLNESHYYDKNLSFSIGCAHKKSQDIFHEWFNELSKI